MKEPNKEKPVEKKEDHRKTRSVALVVLIIILAGAGGTGWYWYSTYFNYINTDSASIESTHVSVASKMMGRVTALYAAEGDTVKKDQVLVQLDDTDLRSQELQLLAALELAKQNQNLAKVSLDRAESDFNRIKQIYSGGFSSKEQYEHAEKALEAAGVQYSIAQGQVGVSEAQLQVLRTQIYNTKIAAPISGVISKKNVSQGEIVQPGLAIFTIIDLNDLWITANIEETRIRLLNTGMEVEISIDAYPGIKLKGTIAKIASGIVPPPFTIGESTKTTQKIPVKITINSVPDSVNLIPGMSVVIRIKVK